MKLKLAEAWIFTLIFLGLLWLFYVFFHVIHDKSGWLGIIATILTIVAFRVMDEQ